MKPIIHAVICALIINGFSIPLANSYPVPKETKIKHVIYVTMDGVRWQDFFSTSSEKYFPKFWSKHANKVQIYGKPKSHKQMIVASVPISLPSYASQMTGYLQPCIDNSCRKIRVETLPEYLINRYKFKIRDVATFASWPLISNVVEHIPQTTYSNIGNVPAYDPATQTADAKMSLLNQAQALDHPVPDEDGAGRFDKYTFAQGMHYFEKFRPKFLWLSFVESDNAAHENDPNYYRRMLTYYDEVIDTLFHKLEELRITAQTMIIVTTDHGRANGKNWMTHGPEYPESKKTWAFVFNGKLKPIGQDNKIERYSTISFKPTIEAALNPLD